MIDAFLVAMVVGVPLFALAAWVASRSRRVLPREPVILRHEDVATALRNHGPVNRVDARCSSSGRDATVEK